jgi:hypothetical protein
MAYRATLERDKEAVSHRPTPDGSNETPKSRSVRTGTKSAREGAESIRKDSKPVRDETELVREESKSSGGETEPVCEESRSSGGESEPVRQKAEPARKETEPAQGRARSVQEGEKLIQGEANLVREGEEPVGEGAGSAREEKQPVRTPPEQGQEGQERNQRFKKQKRPWSPYKKYHLPQVIRSSYSFELLADNKGTYAPARALTTPDTLSDLQRRILQIVTKSWKTAHEEHKDEIVARFGLPEKVRRWDRWDYGPTFSELINELGIRQLFPTRYLCTKELYGILRWMRLWGLIEGVGDKNKPRNLRPGPRITGELIDITEWRKRPRDTQQEEMQPPRETCVEQT